MNTSNGIDSLSQNSIYYDGTLVQNVQELPDNVIVLLDADSARNVVHLQKISGSGSLVVDLRGESNCRVLLGTGNEITSGTLRIHFPSEPEQIPDVSYVDIGHLNTFLGNGTIAAPNAYGVSIGSGNSFGDGFTVRGDDYVIYDLRDKTILNPTSGLRIGSRNHIRENVVVASGGAIGDDTIVNVGSMVISDWTNERNVILEGRPSRVIRENVGWRIATSRQRSKRPLLTIGITTYERPETVNRAVQSILSQTIPEGSQVEVFVVDDGSTSESYRDFVRMLESLKVGDQISVTALRNRVATGGPSEGRNTVIDVATGRYVMFLDDDDFFVDESLSELLEYIGTSDSQRVTMRHRRAGRSIYRAPAKKQIRVDIVDSLWTMLALSAFRLDDVRSFGSRFPSGVHYGEDSEFVLHFSVRAEAFMALCDRDYIVRGDPFPGENAHLSQGSGSWLSFMRGILSHLDRFADILDTANLPIYIRDRLAARVLLDRSVGSYQMLRRISEMSKDAIAQELLDRYAATISRTLPDEAVLRFAKGASLEQEFRAVLARDISALRRARNKTVI
ncbi:glycosyltransferase [Isoptericola sp. NPDC019482]|uniref:glycosyltransferase n=1 Tax=Isoptericola sp. NPDC019482 TaxID=3154688 RepID=UPI00347EC770